MGLDQHRVGVDVEERIDGTEMARGFQDPALTFVVELHVLQEAAVVMIGLGHVLLEQPLVVGRDVEAHLEADAHELRGRRHDALLGHQRTDRMDRLEAGCEAVHLLEALAGRLDARIAVIGRGFSGRTGIVDLPGERGTVPRILGEQPVEQGRPGPGQPHDEERPLDLLPGDRVIAVAIVGESQAMGEELEHLPAREIAAKKVQAGVFFEGLEELREARAEARQSEIV